MLAHLHEPEITQLSTRRLSEADTARVHRHLQECELCLRRLIEVERLASMDSTERIHVFCEDEVQIRTTLH